MARITKTIGKTFAVAAMGGMAVGSAAALTGCAKDHAGDSTSHSASKASCSAAGAKHACKGQNACKGQGGCKVEGKHSCKGQNACKGQGGCKA